MKEEQDKALPIYQTTISLYRQQSRREQLAPGRLGEKELAIYRQRGQW